MKILLIFILPKLLSLILLHTWEFAFCFVISVKSSHVQFKYYNPLGSPHLISSMSLFCLLFVDNCGPGAMLIPGILILHIFLDSWKGRRWWHFENVNHDLCVHACCHYAQVRPFQIWTVLQYWFHNIQPDFALSKAGRTIAVVLIAGVQQHTLRLRHSPVCLISYLMLWFVENGRGTHWLICLCIAVAARELRGF